MEPQIFESRPNEHLDTIVGRAASSEGGEPAKVIDLQTPADEDETGAVTHPHVQIEAAFGRQDGKRVTDTLEVRIRRYGMQATRPLLRDFLEHFGSTRYTSLSTVNAPAARGEFDVTVLFPTRVFPFFSRNIALIPEQPMERAGRAMKAILQELGVQHRYEGSGIVVPSWQLRRPLTREAQVRAYEAARQTGVPVSLYAAAIPVAQSVRIEEGRDRPEGAREEMPYVDCFVSRGLSPSLYCNPEDAAEMEATIQRHFGIDFGGRVWSLIRDQPPASGTSMVHVLHPQSEEKRRLDAE